MPDHRTISLTCPICEAQFSVKPSHAKRRRYCSKRCMAVAYADRISGENNFNWRGGRRPYYGPSWRPAMRAVRVRDQVCQRCQKSSKETGRALDVHHVVPFRAFGLARHAEANTLSNLIAYCNPCHLLVEWEVNRTNLQYARWNEWGPLTADNRPVWQGPRVPPEHVLKGSSHPRSKLTDDDVLTIRADYAAKRATQVALAARYSVKQAHISSIVLGKTWKHLPLTP